MQICVFFLTFLPFTFGIVREYNYQQVIRVSEQTLSGYLVEVEQMHSVIQCAVRCAALQQCDSYAFEPLTSECRTYNVPLQEDVSATESVAVRYYTLLDSGTCVDPPYFDLAYGQLVSSNDTSNQTGQMSYPAGVQFQYRCLLDHYFVGESNITCLPSGFWTDQVTQAGCSVKPDGLCVTDADCSPVASAVCTDGLCRCPLNFTFIASRAVCICDCLTLYEAGLTSDGAHDIMPDGVITINAYCDMTAGGWTLFQRRVVGDVDFKSATWNQSVEGFGDPQGDHWLGLRHIHTLTWIDNEIHFEMKLENSTYIFFHHYNFSVGDSSTMYGVNVSQEYESNAFTPAEYEAFYRHSNMMFSTFDNDNDYMSGFNCAQVSGPWWHYKCGIFGNFNAGFNAMGISKVPPLLTQLAFTESRMKIRRQT